MTSIEIARFHAGDPDFFRTIHARVQPVLARHVRRFVPDVDDQEDVLQEIWIRIFERRAAYSGTGSFDGWAVRIARRFCLMRRREAAAVYHLFVARYWALEVGTESMPEREAVARALQIQGLHDLTINTIMALPPRQRIIAIARWQAGLSVKEVAALLHVAPGTVKATLHHARRNVRAALTGIDPGVRDAVDEWIDDELPTPLVHGCSAIIDNPLTYAHPSRPLDATSAPAPRRSLSRTESSAMRPATCTASTTYRATAASPVAVTETTSVSRTADTPVTESRCRRRRGRRA